MEPPNDGTPWVSQEYHEAEVARLRAEIREMLINPKDGHARLATLFGIPFETYYRFLNAIESDTGDAPGVVLKRNYYLEARLAEVTSTIEAIPFSERQFPTRQDMRVEIARLQQENFAYKLSMDQGWAEYDECRKALDSERSRVKSWEPLREGKGE